MSTPFPGMDPYLEGYLWPDVHQELASAIKGMLAPQISPNYVARLNLYTVEDTSPEEDVGIMYPDVETLRRREGEVKESSAIEYAGGIDTLTPATISLDLAFPIEVRIPVVEIRDRQNNQLITAIEILSPVNKRHPGLEPYRNKRFRLHETGVHLLEIDLLRRGERPLKHPYLPKSHYMALLTRAELSKTHVWAFNLDDPLPVLPVPLKAPDPDVPLVLRKALEEIYNRSQYNLSINYREDPPPPPLRDNEQEWMRQLLKAKIA